MDIILAAILENDRESVEKLLRADAELATRVVKDARLYESKIFHWIYVGDTALHLAAAGYRVEIAELLLTAGANPNAAMNHRQSGPLHYAADGYINGPAWDAERQVKTIRCLLDAVTSMPRTRMALPLCTAPYEHGVPPLCDAF